MLSLVCQTIVERVKEEEYDTSDTYYNYLSHISYILYAIQYNPHD